MLNLNQKDAFKVWLKRVQSVKRHTRAIEIWLHGH